MSAGRSHNMPSTNNDDHDDYGQMPRRHGEFTQHIYCNFQIELFSFGIIGDSSIFHNQNGKFMIT